MTTKKKSIKAAKSASASKEPKTATKKITKRAIKAAKPSTAKAKAKEEASAKLIVKADIGWGNVLYARGEGAGLSWDRGTPLANTNADTWVFDTSEETQAVVMKLLINDQEWAEGDNLELSQGKTIIVKPKFVQA